MLTFTQYILVYTIIITTVLILIIRIFNIKSSTNVTKIKQEISFFLTFGLVIYILPHVISLSANKYSYPNPDTYSYVVSITKENWQDMPIDPYYKTFPIYVIINKFVYITTGLEIHDTLVLVQIINSMMTIIYMLLYFNYSGYSIGNRLFLLFYPLIIACSIYLYGYIDIMIPQTFGLLVLLMLLSNFIKYHNSRNLNNIVVSILILPLSLIHFSIIPIYLFLIVLTIFFSKFKLKVYKNTIVFSILPFVFHIFYIFYAYNPANLQQYIIYYVQLLNNIIYSPNEIIPSLSNPVGIPRVFPYLNAFGPATYLSITLLGIYMLLKRSVRQEVILYAVLSLGLTFIALGFSRLYVFVEIPSGSIARYVNVYGLLLLSLFNIFVLIYLFNKRNNVLNITLAAILILGFVGSVLDPFAFPTRPSQEQVMLSASISTLLFDNSNLYFASPQGLYYIGPSLSLWAQLSGKDINVSLTHILIDNNSNDILFNSQLISILQNQNKIILISR